ncbi:MAG: transposase [Nitrospiria bacterium]
MGIPAIYDRSHVLNRGNGRATIFHKDADYRAFCDLLSTAQKKFPVGLLGFCVMPNHFHLVLQPQTPSALSAMMQLDRAHGSHPRAGIHTPSARPASQTLPRKVACPLFCVMDRYSVILWEVGHEPQPSVGRSHF